LAEQKYAEVGYASQKVGLGEGEPVSHWGGQKNELGFKKSFGKNSQFWAQEGKGVFGRRNSFKGGGGEP